MMSEMHTWLVEAEEWCVQSVVRTKGGREEGKTAQACIDRHNIILCAPGLARQTMPFIHAPLSSPPPSLAHLHHPSTHPHARTSEKGAISAAAAAAAAAGAAYK